MRQEGKISGLRIADAGEFGQGDQHLDAFAASAVEIPALGQGFSPIANAGQVLRIFAGQRVADQFGQECCLGGRWMEVFVAHYQTYRQKESGVEKKS